jgi:hypothetical protein
VLLSELEQISAIRDLLGLEAVPAADGLPTDSGRTLDLDLINQMSASYLDTHDQRVTAVGQNVKARAASLTQCAAGTAADACARQYALKLAERAFRRPVPEEELTELMLAYQAGAAISPDDGIATLTQAILFAPSAMYRRELGGAPTGQAVTLNSWEMADQLSHLLYNSIPDDGLIAAAKADALTTDQGIQGELDRLLATDRVKKSLTQTMLAWLQTVRLTQKQKGGAYAAQPVPWRRMRPGPGNNKRRDGRLAARCHSSDDRCDRYGNAFSFDNRRTGRRAVLRPLGTTRWQPMFSNGWCVRVTRGLVRWHTVTGLGERGELSFAGPLTCGGSKDASIVLDVCPAPERVELARRRHRRPERGTPAHCWSVGERSGCEDHGTNAATAHARLAAE